MAPASATSGQYQAAVSARAWADLSDRPFIRVTGDDRVSFLQGMVTNDVEGLAVGAHCYAAMLTPKGAMVGDVRIVKRETDLLLDTGPGRRDAVRDFLNKYLISEDAELHDADDVAALALVGPTAGSLLAQIGATLGTLPSTVSPGLDVVIERSRLDEVRAALASVPQLDTATLEVLRVEQGRPVFGIDMTETTIPLEANLESAIHYNKGCYIGQEVIARATYRGQMNKKLVGVLLNDLAAERMTELRVGEKKVGWLTSVVRSERRGQYVALGYVHRDHLAPGTTLTLASGGTAEVCALPF